MFYYNSIQEESLINVDVEKELLNQAMSTNRSMDRIFPNDQVSLVRRLYVSAMVHVCVVC